MAARRGARAIRRLEAGVWRKGARAAERVARAFGVARRAEATQLTGPARAERSVEAMRAGGMWLDPGVGEG